MNIYDFIVKNNKGEDVSLSEYKGKVLLIINSATECGLTPQYNGLEALYKKYKDKGFEILDFPCNQFLNQAPGTNEEISQFCMLNFGTTFPLFAKIDVNGQNADPLYVWLKEQAPEDKENADSLAFGEKIKGLYPLEKANDIKWNFGKFLIDRNGNIYERYAPGYKSEQLEEDIEKLLDN